MAKFQKGHVKVGGRKRGTPNKTTRELKIFMESILFDDPDTTHQRLIGLRDSDEAADRRIFWSVATKLIPQAVEGKIDVGLPTLTLVQDYVNGQTREVVDGAEGTD